MNLSIQAIVDYMHCPLAFRYRYIDKVDYRFSFVKSEVVNNIYIADMFDMLLHHLAYGFFHQMTEGRYPSLYNLKLRWGKLWNEGRTKEDIMFTPYSWRNVHRKKERAGLNALIRMHAAFKEQVTIPILVGKQYTVSLGSHTITGVIDLVRETEDRRGNRIIELVDFKTQDKYRNIHHLGDLELTASVYAFEKLFGKRPDRITYYRMLTGKFIRVERDENDYKLLEQCVEQVARAIEQRIFYPVINDRCAECPFHSKCVKKEWFSNAAV